MDDKPKTYTELAGQLENSSLDLLSEAASHGVDASEDLTPQMKMQLLVSQAEAQATIALSMRVADFTDRFEKSVEYVGDRIDAQVTP